MQSRGWTEKRLNSECQQTHILQALDLITPFMIAQVRLHNPADSFSFPSNRFRSDIPIANSPRYRNIELCGATTVPFQADFPTKVLAIYNSGILDSLHSAQYQIKAAHYFTRVCPYIIKRAHKLLFATRDATAAIPGLYPPAFTITHYILPHMNQIVEREGNFDFPLSNIPQSHNLAHMVNPIPVSGGDLFRLALDAGSVDPVLIFITHCAFDHLNGLLDWVPMLSKFGDNSSLGYGLRSVHSLMRLTLQTNICTARMTQSRIPGVTVNSMGATTTIRLSKSGLVPFAPSSYGQLHRISPSSVACPSATSKTLRLTLLTAPHYSKLSDARRSIAEWAASFIKGMLAALLEQLFRLNMATIITSFISYFLAVHTDLYRPSTYFKSIADC